MSMYISYSFFMFIFAVIFETETQQFRGYGENSDNVVGFVDLFLVKVEYLNDRKTLTAVLGIFFFSLTQNQHYS